MASCRTVDRCPHARGRCRSPSCQDQLSTILSSRPQEGDERCLGIASIEMAHSVTSRRRAIAVTTPTCTAFPSAANAEARDAGRLSESGKF